MLDIRRLQPASAAALPGSSASARARLLKHSEWCLHQYRSRFPRPLVRCARFLAVAAVVVVCLPALPPLPLLALPAPELC